MDGKENTIATGTDAAAEAQGGRAGAPAAEPAGAQEVGASGDGAGAVVGGAAGGASGAGVSGGAGSASGAGQAGRGDKASGIDYAAELASRDAQIAERDGRISELEGRLAEAGKVGEENAALKSENEQLKNQAASERIDFALQLAGCRNVKAARAVLDDYDGDVDALKAAEPWLFAAHASGEAGATGLPNAGAAKGDGRDERRWRKLAGLGVKKDDK